MTLILPGGIKLLKKICALAALFNGVVAFAQITEQDVSKLYSESGFQKACVFSINNSLDSALFYVLESTNFDHMTEVILVHPDLQNLRGDSVKWARIQAKLYAKYKAENPDITKPKIGFELLKIYADDQKKRSLHNFMQIGYGDKKENFSIEQHNIDKKNRIERIEQIIDDYGWLGYSEVGEKPANAIFFVIQHSYPEDNLLEKYLPLLIELALKNEASKVNAAKMIDRYLYRKKGVQIYGTQTVCKTIKKARNCELVRVLDEQGLNERRSKLGLESIEIACRKLGFEYQRTEKNKKIKKKYCKMKFLDIIK